MESPSRGEAGGAAARAEGTGESPAPGTPRAEGTPGRAGGGEELPPRLGLSAQREQRGAMSLGEAALLPFPHLSGAVDVVAVRQADGSIKCSPFYVRFGKYQGLLRRRDKLVKIHINGQEVPLNMYVGRTGEAYFVQPVGGGLGAGEGEVSAAEDLPAYTVANHSYLLGGGRPAAWARGGRAASLGIQTPGAHMATSWRLSRRDRGAGRPSGVPSGASSRSWPTPPRAASRRHQGSASRLREAMTWPPRRLPLVWRRTRAARLRGWGATGR